MDKDLGSEALEVRQDIVLDICLLDEDYIDHNSQIILLDTFTSFWEQLVL